MLNFLFSFFIIFFSFLDPAFSSSYPLGCDPEEMKINALTLEQLKWVIRAPFLPGATKAEERPYHTLYPEHPEKFTGPADVIWSSWEKLYERSSPEKLKDQGIFAIHALEDIMGATQCYVLWNKLPFIEKEQPESFARRVKAEDFVNNYVRDVLSV